MEQSDWHIGAPNGVVICINGWKGQQIVGCFYHSYSGKATEFETIDQILFQLEYFFDLLNFPYAATAERTFGRQNRKADRDRKWVKTMKDKELLQKHGELGTFIVRVQHRQHSSWQGRITWVEQNKTMSFRSIWELIKLMVSAVETVGASKEEENLSWFD